MGAENERYNSNICDFSLEPIAKLPVTVESKPDEGHEILFLASVILYAFRICDFSIIWNFSEKRVRSASRLSD